MFENTAGNTDPAVGANFLASFDTTVQAIDTWNVYSLPTPVTFFGPGDAVIGAVTLELPSFSYFPASIDFTTTQGRSWIGWNNASPLPNPPTLTPDSWSLIDAYFPGNWMVRAYGQSAQCPAGPEVGELTSETPVFNRPFGFGAGCSLSGTGTAVHYDVYSYYLGGPAPHDLFASTVGGTSMDTVLIFYQAPDGSANPFDPTQGCLNNVAYNDDFSSLQSQISATNLAAGWVDVVMTTFENDKTGAYTMEVESDSCQGFPNIDVDPLFLSSTQPSDTITQQTLEISNTGTEDLVWEILGELPWLSVDTEDGTTAPGETTPVVVNLDSTGLAAGTYNANLAIFSNDPDNGNGNGTKLVTVPVSMDVEGCETDADCYDDIFCNGLEQCEAGVCVHGEPPFCPSDAPICDEDYTGCVGCLTNADCAEGEICDEALNSCITAPECTVDDNCTDNLFCTGAETCVEGACVDGPGAPCEAGQTCDEALDTCVTVPECTADVDCDDTLFCTGVESCVAGACVDGPGDPCTAGETCDEDGGRCVECLNDSQCVASERCADNVCIARCELSVEYKPPVSAQLKNDKKVKLNITGGEGFDPYGEIDLGSFEAVKPKVNDKKGSLKVKAVVPAGTAPGTYPISVGDCIGEIEVL